MPLSGRRVGAQTLRWLARIPSVIVTALMVLAMADMLAGVFLRYVMTRISETFSLPYIEFFWAEEVGEFSLAWLTFIGAAIGIWKGVHFRLHVITHRLPPAGQRLIFSVHAGLIATFGLLVASYGWRVAVINGHSFSPGLSINLFWLYFSAVVGGVLIALYAAATLVRTWRRSGSMTPGPEEP